MIRQTSKILAIAAVVGIAATAHAGTATVSPAFAACSKALVETLAKSDNTMPRYSVKEPRTVTSSIIDPNAFTVIAKNAKTSATLAKASCKATPEGEIVAFKSIPVKS